LLTLNVWKSTKYVLSLQCNDKGGNTMSDKTEEGKGKLKLIELTIQEWFDGMRTPAPHRNKKKFYRKTKHKNKTNE